MALKTMIANLAKARKNYEEQLAKLGDDAQKGIAGTLGELIPEGKVLVWSQYTAYFNDGEPCTFSVHDCYLQDQDEGDDYDPYDGLSTYEKTFPNDLKKVWDSLPEDMMQAAFGDHVKVWIKPGGTFEISDHDHD